MALFLNTTPGNGGTLAFGNVPSGGGSATLHIGAHVTGGVPHVSQVSWSWAITGPNAADFTPGSFSETTTQNEDTSDPVTFTPSSAGAKSATLTITSSDITNSPIVIGLTGTGAAGGQLTLTPQTTNDFGSVKVTVPSSVLNVVLQNNSGTDVIVSAINFNGDYSAGGALPGLPFTQHANHTDPAVLIPVIFTPSVVGFRVTANALSVTNNGTPNPALQSLQGTGFLITPAFVIANTPRRLLLGYSNVMTPTLLQANPDDLNTEESAFIMGVYDYDAPLIDKWVNRHILRAEDLGTFAYTVAVQTVRSTPSAFVSGQGGAADQHVFDSYADVGTSDDLVTIKISRIAAAGPMSITQLFHEVKPGGKHVEGT